MYLLFIPEEVGMAENASSILLACFVEAIHIELNKSQFLPVG
jgi:hypothetical protein